MAPPPEEAESSPTRAAKPAHDSSAPQRHTGSLRAAVHRVKAVALHERAERGSAAPELEERLAEFDARLANGHDRSTSTRDPASWHVD